MADQAQGSTPLQQFIMQHMETQRFMEEQRQAGAQEAIQQGALQNQQIATFFEIAQKVKDPTQLEGFVNWAGGQAPDMADTFRSLADQVVKPLATQEAEAGQIMTPAMWQDALAIQQGRMPTAAQAEQIKLGWKQMGFDEQKWKDTLEENGLQRGLQLLIAEMQNAREGERIGIAQQGVDIQREGLGLQRLGLLQEGETSMRNALVQSDLFPHSVISEHSEALQELIQQRNAAVEAGDVEEQGRLAHEIINTQMSIKDVQRLIDANQAGPGTGGLTQGQALSELAAAWQDVQIATKPGQPGNAALTAAAIDRYNRIAASMGIQPLQQGTRRSGWFGTGDRVPANTVVFPPPQ